MTESLLFSHISALSENLKAEVANFVAFLEHKQKKETKIKERKLGCGKGFFEISPDFDEPLEDLKDYM